MVTQGRCAGTDIVTRREQGELQELIGKRKGGRQSMPEELHGLRRLKPHLCMGGDAGR